MQIWEEDLTFVAQIQAHPTTIYSLTASDDTLYSCSNDGTVKAWELGTLKEKGTIVVGQDEFWKVKYVNGLLYVGDNQGGVSKLQNLSFALSNIVHIVKSIQRRRTNWRRKYLRWNQRFGRLRRFRIHSKGFGFDYHRIQTR